MDITWHLEKRKLKDLSDHPKNPRKITKVQAQHLKQSVQKFGLIDKPIINQDNLIIGGHQRKNILNTLKIKEVECWVPDRLLTEQEVEELNIRLNKNTGEWDFDVLANEWDMPSLCEWGFDPSDFGIDKEIVDNNDDEEKELKKTTCPNCGHQF